MSHELPDRIEERANKLNRFLTGPGGFPHCCAIMIFDEQSKLTFSSTMVARVFGISVLSQRNLFFADIFSDHEQLELNKLIQFSTLKDDWVSTKLTLSHQNRQVTRKLVASCLACQEAQGTSHLFCFRFDDHSQTPIMFFNLFKRAIRLRIDGIAKLNMRTAGVETSFENQHLEHFDEGLCNLFKLPRAKLLNTSLLSLIAPHHIQQSQHIWNTALQGYLDGYSHYKEFIDADGSLVTTRVTSFVLNHTQDFQEYLLLFTLAPRDTSLAVSAFNVDALLAGMSHAGVGLAYLEEGAVTYANDTLIAWGGSIRRNGLDLINWLNQVSPKYRTTIRKQWQRGLRRKQPFTLTFTLKSDPHTPLNLTVIQQENKIGERTIEQLLLIAIKQDLELISAMATLEPDLMPGAIAPKNLTVPDKMIRLTKTEQHIAELIKTGQSSKEIARELGISPGTVNIHRKNIRRKLDLTGEKINLTSALAEQK